MKNLLLVVMQYRNGERIYPAMPLLSKDFNIDVFKCYQMHPSHRWVGDNDLRKLFDNLYSEHIKNVFLDFNEIDFSKYDCILMEDNRRKADGGILSAIYSKSKCLTIGCTHGSGDAGYEIDGHKKAWDKCFVFGKSSATESFHIPGGIPCNDDLKKYQNIKKEHVLIVCNFLGNRSVSSWVKFRKFDENFFNGINISRVQDKYQKKIVIKLKSRDDEHGYKHNINYLKSILPKSLDYKVVVDCEDDNLLIAQSVAVISAPSTLALKPIQFKIPTVLIKNFGQTGMFENYSNLIELDEDKVFKALDSPIDIDFIENTIEGGLTFNSTQIFVDKIKELL